MHVRTVFMIYLTLTVAVVQAEQNNRDDVYSVNTNKFTVLIQSFGKWLNSMVQTLCTKLDVQSFNQIARRRSQQILGIHIPIPITILAMTAITVAILAFMVPRGSTEYTHETFGFSTNKVPPKWSPDMEKHYSLETWMKDIMLWSANAMHEMDVKQLGPLVAMGLGGEARTIAREMDVNELQRGRRNDAQNINLTGLECLLERLENAFGLSQQEQQISAISELLNFARYPQESTDQVLTRFEISREQARIRGRFTMSAPGMSWLLLKVINVPVSQWTLVLHQFNGNLPSDEDQYRRMLQYLRLNGHLYDRNADNRKSINQPFFANESESNTGTQQYLGLGSTNSQEVPAEDDGESSAWSDDHEQIDYTDVAWMTENDAAEHIYIQYRFAKRRWRHFGGRGKRFFRRSFKDKGKGKRRFPQRFGMRQGKGTYFDIEQDDEDHIAAYLEGKSNPLGKDGKPLQCSICQSTQHFRAKCPRNRFKGGKGMSSKGKGKGKGKSPNMNNPTPDSMYWWGWQQYDDAWDEQEQGEEGTGGAGTTTEQNALSSSSGNTNLPLYFANAVEHASDGSIVVRANGVSVPPPSYPAPSTFSSYSSKYAFVTWIVQNVGKMATYHTAVRLQHKEGLLVDTGAIDNLMGSRFFDRIQRIVRNVGKTCSSKPMMPVSIDGVGTGSSVAEQRCTIPICMPDGVESLFEGSVINNSELPALWGLTSLSSHFTLIDTRNKQLYFVGPGGYELKLSKGSRVVQCEMSPSGHMLMPVTEWKQTKPRKSAATHVNQHSH